LKILVTGAAGFLGSNLVSKLVEQGHDVVGVDSLVTGTLRNLLHLESQQNFTFHEADIICFSETLQPGFDQIYHLASPASPPKYIEYSYETMMVNTLATDRLSKYALLNESRILFSSTSEIYGDPLVHPQTEDYWGNVNTLGVRSVYDESKRFGETIISHHKRVANLNAIIVRIFNTYGPRMDPYDGRVVTNFVRQILERKPVTIYGDGLQTRSFCYVDDLIEGLILAMNSKEFGPINLGNPNEFTLMELLQKIDSLLNLQPEIIFQPIPEDDPKMRRPDISRAQNILGWSPQVDLIKGLAPTIEWVRSQLK
jgi:nucleoside-diphosphate-sugar epimerase